jgi:hypothetical protein
MLTACGRLGCIEAITISTHEIPQDVSEIIEDEYPGAEVVAADEHQDGGTYDVEIITADGDRLLVEVDELGSIVELDLSVRNHACD